MVQHRAISFVTTQQRKNIKCWWYATTLKPELSEDGHNVMVYKIAKYPWENFDTCLHHCKTGERKEFPVRYLIETGCHSCWVFYQILICETCSAITIFNCHVQPFSSSWRWSDLMWFIVFNATFSNISTISWRPVLVVEETGVPGENHRPWPSNW